MFLNLGRMAMKMSFVRKFLMGVAAVLLLPSVSLSETLSQEKEHVVKFHVEFCGIPSYEFLKEVEIRQFYDINIEALERFHKEKGLKEQGIEYMQSYCIEAKKDFSEFWVGKEVYFEHVDQIEDSDVFFRVLFLPTMLNFLKIEGSSKWYFYTYPLTSSDDKPAVYEKRVPGLYGEGFRSTPLPMQSIQSLLVNDFLKKEIKR